MTASSPRDEDGPGDGLATVLYKDTNTGGAVSRSKNGALFIAERGLGSAIEQLGHAEREKQNHRDADDRIKARLDNLRYGKR